jgi:steroid 5-alpha reductase family enzyme
MEVFFIIFFLYLILFWISIKIKDNSIVDIFWWTWFVIIAIYLYFLNSSFWIIETISLLLIIFWWTRLSYYIWKRKLREKSEDPRYAIWRKEWKYFYTRSFFQVFILQMLLMFLVAFPIYFIFSWNEINLYLFIFWFTVSIIWLIFEVISDYQVKKYIKENGKTNKVFTWWLYKYSRNPNYFWESTFWFWLGIIWASISLLSFVWYIIITFLLSFTSWFK